MEMQPAPRIAMINDNSELGNRVVAFADFAAVADASFWTYMSDLFNNNRFVSA
jgi:hypothetical protein